MSAGRRVLAVVECRPSDTAVLHRAVAVANESGGYLTLVAIAPGPVLNPGPYCFPQPSAEQRREAAANDLRRLAALVPPEIPLITAVDEGKPAAVVGRRVETAAHDLVVIRRRRAALARWSRPLLAPVLAVVG
jgi:hypothetical protein